VNNYVAVDFTVISSHRVNLARQFLRWILDETSLERIPYGMAMVALIHSAKSLARLRLRLFYFTPLPFYRALNFFANHI
jgi:hypothetical protein